MILCCQSNIYLIKNSPAFSIDDNKTNCCCHQLRWSKKYFAFYCEAHRENNRKTKISFSVDPAMFMAPCLPEEEQAARRQNCKIISGREWQVGVLRLSQSRSVVGAGASTVIVRQLPSNQWTHLFISDTAVTRYCL